jgi:hypothetical protein
VSADAENPAIFYDFVDGLRRAKAPRFWSKKRGTVRRTAAADNISAQNFKELLDDPNMATRGAMEVAGHWGVKTHEAKVSHLRSADIRRGHAGNGG